MSIAGTHYDEMKTTGKIAEKLARLIDNQSVVAKKTGLVASAISEATAGKRRLYVDQAFKVARALGVSLDFLADDAQDEPPRQDGPSEDDQYVLRVFHALGIDADEAVRRMALELPRGVGRGVALQDQNAQARREGEEWRSGLELDSNHEGADAEGRPFPRIPRPR